ncbi:uncharacterized protein LOC121504604 [Cheilinus undulatus]|uniref:uncharacterized protein LOC121504604 n=1 Tax=Cheilinus undulatus TaxID=241271 RepID=UPI001BD4D26C|nr:uncharacterized protein LOC121504604 [Cheilinus undulatus]
MTSPTFVFILTCLVLGLAAQTAVPKPPSAVRHESREPGESVTLECPFKNDESSWIYWFKQTLGEDLRLICSTYRYGKNATYNSEFKNNPRFVTDTQNGKNRLTISDLQVSDSATYHCITSDYSMLEILATITVSVKGSGVSVPALVHQSESETIQPGGSVTLNCTVHTGTYYCTVVSRGDVTKLDFGDEVSSGVLVYSLSGALIFQTVLIGVLVLVTFLAFTVRMINRRKKRKSNESSSDIAEDYQNLQQLCYAAVNMTKRSRRQRDLTWSECVYHTLRK